MRFVHEADVLAVGNHLNDVAGEQRAFASPAMPAARQDKLDCLAPAKLNLRFHDVTSKNTSPALGDRERDKSCHLFVLRIWVRTCWER